MHESLLFSLEFAALASHTLATKTNFSSVRPFPCYEVIIIVIDLRISHAADTARAKKINYFSLFPSLASKVLCFLFCWFVNPLDFRLTHDTKERPRHTIWNAKCIKNPPAALAKWFLFASSCLLFFFPPFPSLEQSQGSCFENCLHRRGRKKEANFSFFNSTSRWSFFTRSSVCCLLHHPIQRIPVIDLHMHNT